MEPFSENLRSTTPPVAVLDLPPSALLRETTSSVHVVAAAAGFPSPVSAQVARETAPRTERALFAGTMAKKARDQDSARHRALASKMPVLEQVDRHSMFNKVPLAPDVAFVGRATNVVGGGKYMKGTHVIP